MHKSCGDEKLWLPVSVTLAVVGFVESVEADVEFVEAAVVVTFVVLFDQAALMPRQQQHSLEQEIEVSVSLELVLLQQLTTPLPIHPAMTN